MAMVTVILPARVDGTIPKSTRAEIQGRRIICVVAIPSIRRPQVPWYVFIADSRLMFRQ